MKLIDGKQIANTIYSELKIEIQDLKIKPKLGIILASDDPSSELYIERMKMKKAEMLGIETVLKKYNSSATLDEILEGIDDFNLDDEITGVLVQIPFYEHLEQYRSLILNSVDPLKDVDGLTTTNLGIVTATTSPDILPATVDAIVEAIKSTLNNSKEVNNKVSDEEFKTFLKGKNIVIINNSILIGKPLAMYLSSLDATVTLLNKFTTNINQFSLKADILVSATDQTNLIDFNMVKNNSILIDVTSMKVKEKVIGDIILSDELMKMDGFLTPVPGGVGPLTIACLMRNIIKLTKLQTSKSDK